MSVIERNNVQINGTGDRTVVFAHGFGCDQNMWRFVEPAFRDRFRTLLFDHVGAGRSDLTAYVQGGDKVGHWSAGILTVRAE
jgi:sigma-B regulation protein RsbQ